jgi:hypothetical protein
LPDQIAMTGHALTANEFANILAVSHVTIFKQAKAERIPSFRIGTCVRFDSKEGASLLRKMWNSVIVNVIGDFSSFSAAILQSHLRVTKHTDRIHWRAFVP